MTSSRFFRHFLPTLLASIAATILYNAFVVPAPAPTASRSSVSTVLSAPRAETVRVSRVVDGDTIDVTMPDGAKEKVRLLGINTPETVDPRKPVQCFGHEASDHTKALLTGQTVTLANDPSQDDRDKYDRLLRYVGLADGTDINLALVRDGYAHEYTYDRPYARQAAYRAAEADARAAGRGLWNPQACAGRP